MTQYLRGWHLIPGGANTLSKSPSRYVETVPAYVTQGHGCRVLGDDHQWYIDFGMGLGACILGYANPRVNAAVKHAIDQGVLFTQAASMEVEAAQKLLHYVPWADQVKFGKNGTDVLTAAVRLARHTTGRDVVWSVGYHGWADWSLGPPAHGIPERVRQLSAHFSTVDALVTHIQDGSPPFSGHEQRKRRRLWPMMAPSTGENWPESRRPACMVIETGQDARLPNLAQLAYLRRVCTEWGALLVFDEVLSGFRYRLGSAIPEVEPDLACFGKSIGNGFPVSALVGKSELMHHFEPNGVFFSGTAFGDTVGLSALIETLRIMDEEDVPNQLSKQGARLRDYFNAAAQLRGSDFPLQCQGDGARTVVRGLSHAMSDLFQQECAKEGLLFMGAHNLSIAHDDRAVDLALGSYRTAMDALVEAGDDEGARARLKGSPTIIPYRVQ